MAAQQPQTQPQVQLRLAPAPAAAVPLPVVAGAADAVGRCAVACTADGRLFLLPAQPHAAAADTDAFALMLLRTGAPPQLLARPWAALALLGSSSGLLCAQAGSGRLLCCQHPAAALELGEDGAAAFLLGCHEEPISAVAASPCGSLALSADEGGGLKLWSLAGGEQLGAVWGGTGSGPVAAACFLPDGAVATARGGIVSVWQTPSLELAAELVVTVVTGGSLGCPGNGGTHNDGGSGGTSASAGRVITALAAGGELLAVGCSDGATLMWRHQGASEFAQHALLPAPTSAAAAVTTLAISHDATLLAAAAGTAVSICCTATGQLLAQQALHAAPVSLLWAGDSGQLLALMPEGRLQPLGAPESHMAPTLLQGSGMPSAAAAAGEDLAGACREAGLPQPAVGPAAAAAAAISRHKKSVRFSEAASQLPEPVMRQGRMGMPLAARHAPPPPLPSHPLLRGGTVAGRRGVGVPSQQDALASQLSDSRGSDSGSRGSAAVLGRQRMRSASGPAPRAAAPPTKPVQPLYPILDLRALRGLQAAAPAPAAASAPAVCSPPCSPLKLARRLPQAALATAAPTAAAVSSINLTRSMRHAATSTSTGPGTGPDMSSWQWEGQREGERMDAGGLQPPQPEEAAPAPVAVPFEAAAEPPRRLQLPTPVQRQASPGRASKQRCGACIVQQPDTSGASSGSRPGSPSKQVMLSQLAAMRKEAGTEAVLADAQDKSHPEAADPGCQRSTGSASRPTSPVKLGVACTKEEQLKGEVQPVEVKAVAVEELDASLPLEAVRRQRFARLSRRSTFAKQQEPMPWEKQQHHHQEMKQEQEQQQHNQPGCTLKLSQQDEPLVEAAGHLSTEAATAGAAATTAGPFSEGSSAACDLGAAPRLSDGPAAAPAAGSAATEAVGKLPAAVPAAVPAEQAPSVGFAVSSDTELTSDDDEEMVQKADDKQQRSRAHGNCPPAKHVRVVSVFDGAAASSEASADSLPEAAAVQPLLGSAAPASAPAAHLSSHDGASGVAAMQPTARRMPSALQGEGSIAAGAAACHSTGAGAVSSLLSPVAGLLRQLDSRLSSLSIRAQRQALPGQASGPAAQPLQPHELGPSRQPVLQQTVAPPRAQLPAQPPPPRAAGNPAQFAPAPMRTSGAARQGAALAAAACAKMEPAPAACEPASALAVPAPNSRLLYLHKAEVLEQQAVAAAVATVPEEQMLAARQRAATAATTLAPGGRLFGALPPPEAAPPDRHSLSLSPTKAAALAGAKKQLDERWVAQQTELQPRLEQLWVAEQRVPQQSGLLPLPALTVPLPTGRHLAAHFLGLQQCG